MMTTPMRSSPAAVAELFAAAESGLPALPKIAGSAARSKTTRFICNCCARMVLYATDDAPHVKADVCLACYRAGCLGQYGRAIRKCGSGRPWGMEIYPVAQAMTSLSLSDWYGSTSPHAADGVFAVSCIGEGGIDGGSRSVESFYLAVLEEGWLVAGEMNRALGADDMIRATVHHLPVAVAATLGLHGLNALANANSVTIRGVPTNLRWHELMAASPARAWLYPKPSALVLAARLAYTWGESMLLLDDSLPLTLPIFTGLNGSYVLDSLDLPAPNLAPTSLRRALIQARVSELQATIPAVGAWAEHIANKKTATRQEQERVLVLQDALDQVRGIVQQLVIS